MIKIATESADAFQTAQKYLIENNMAMAMDIKSVKSLKFVIRGLPLFTKVEDIDEDLHSNNIEPFKIAYLTNQKTKEEI